jgi:hypothetical protein
MRLRTAAVGVALTVGGLAGAVGIGLAANSISGDNVGLSAEPLSAGDALAPSASSNDAAAARERRRVRVERRRAERRAAKREALQRVEPTSTAPAPTPSTPVEPPDDDGGRSGDDRDSSGPGSGGDDHSGSDDDSSGPGSGDDD